ATIFVAGLFAQPYGYGVTRIAADDCCCQSEPASDNGSTCDGSDSACCPGDNKPSDYSPCTCMCSTCSVMVRTVNLFSFEPDLALLFTQDAERLTFMPTHQPASASLGVDIQPPIA
ncbi:MAG: hypothetical protein AAF085_09230, partial [Planctomycetota bacterium]